MASKRMVHGSDGPGCPGSSRALPMVMEGRCRVVPAPDASIKGWISGPGLSLDHPSRPTDPRVDPGCPGAIPSYPGSYLGHI